MSNVPNEGTGENAEPSFPSFYEGWLLRQQYLLNQLIAAQQQQNEDDDYLNGLISQVLDLHQQFLEAKFRIAKRDIFLVFSPTWFTTLEKSFLWISGFKPSMALKIVSGAVDDLSEDQMQKLAKLINETEVAQVELDHKLAKRQERTADPRVLRELKEIGRGGTNEELLEEEEDSMLKSLRSGIEGVVEKADSLRRGTTLKIVELLNPVQNVKFLVTATKYQMRIRNCGVEIDAHRAD